MVKSVGNPKFEFLLLSVWKYMHENSDIWHWMIW